MDDANFGNNDLPGAPRHFVIAELRYQHGSGFWIAPGVEVVPHGYFVNSENNARTEAYTLFNVRLGYDYKPWNLGVFLEGRNLTNASYVSSVQVDASNRRFFRAGRRPGDLRRRPVEVEVMRIARALPAASCCSCPALAGAAELRPGPRSAHASRQRPRGARLRPRAGGGARRHAARHLGSRGGPREARLRRADR